MARRPSKHLRPARPLSQGFATASREGEWVVQRISGGHSLKTYLCPSCHRPIPPGTPHVVVWPRTPHVGATSPVDERRHWHTSCWERSRP